MECPCCGSGEFAEYPALIAPFIADYVLARPPGPTALLQCRGCTFRFFADRFEEAEAAALYSGYRGERYLRERRRHEFWYSAKLNDAIGHDPREIAARKARAMEFLGPRLPAASVARILDYGGDSGQFIPDQLGAERFVFDISGATPAPGVSLIASAAGLQGQAFDLILLGHVLEHLSAPEEILGTIGALAGRGGAVLIEVPLERFGLRFVPAGGWAARLYRAWLSVLARSAALLRAADFYSTAARVKLGLVPPLGFAKLHEHINFFNPQSLRTLLERAGFEVIDCRPAEGGGLPPVVFCLARKRSGDGRGPFH